MLIHYKTPEEYAYQPTENYPELTEEDQLICDYYDVANWTSFVVDRIRTRIPEFPRIKFDIYPVHSNCLEPKILNKIKQLERRMLGYLTETAPDRGSCRPSPENARGEKTSNTRIIKTLSPHLEKRKTTFAENTMVRVYENIGNEPQLNTPGITNNRQEAEYRYENITIPLNQSGTTLPLNEPRQDDTGELPDILSPTTVGQEIEIFSTPNNGGVVPTTTLSEFANIAVDNDVRQRTVQTTTREEENELAEWTAIDELIYKELNNVSTQRIQDSTGKNTTLEGTIPTTTISGTESRKPSPARKRIRRDEPPPPTKRSLFSNSHSPNRPIPIRKSVSSTSTHSSVSSTDKESIDGITTIAKSPTSASDIQKPQSPVTPHWNNNESNAELWMDETDHPNEEHNTMGESNNSNEEHQLPPTPTTTPTNNIHSPITPSPLSLSTPVPSPSLIPSFSPIPSTSTGITRDGLPERMELPSEPKTTTSFRMGNTIIRSGLTPIAEEAIEDSEIEILGEKEIHNGDASEREEEYYDGAVDTGNHQLYTFVFYGKFSTKRIKHEPNFIRFDHGDHQHIVFTTQPSNKRRAFERICQYHQLSAPETARAWYKVIKVTGEPVRFIYYLIRYGLRTYTEFGNGLAAMPNLWEQIKGIIGSSKNEDATKSHEACMSYILQNKNERQRKTNYTLMLQELFPYIKEHKIKEMGQWWARTSVDYNKELFAKWGKSYETNVKMIITMYKESEQNIDPGNIISIARTLHEEEKFANDAIVWIFDYFAQQRLCIVDFFAKVYIVFAKLAKKVNTIYISGPTNTGKSMLIKLLTGPLNSTRLNRQGDASAFYFENLINAKIGVMEEPTLSATTINSWKLLLGGEDYVTDRKNSSKETITRIPFLITANDETFGYNIEPRDRSALEERLFRFSFDKRIKSHNVSHAPIDPFPREITYYDLYECIYMLADRILEKTSVVLETVRGKDVRDPTVQKPVITDEYLSRWQNTQIVQNIQEKKRKRTHPHPEE